MEDYKIIAGKPDFSVLGRDFRKVVLDPRIRTKSSQFIEFVLKNGLTPENAKQAFKEHLGKVRVYRGLCLNEGTEGYRRIFEQKVLYSRAAAAQGLEYSLKREKQIGYLRGVHARLHEEGTEYEESDFVFSVAKFPEPQIAPVIDRMHISDGKGYLLQFDMPTFDLLGITIADIVRGDEKNPYLFRHRGILFNGSDPDVEIFGLHKTHMSDLSCTVFSSPEQIYNFCRPYNQSMNEKFCPTRQHVL